MQACMERQLRNGAREFELFFVTPNASSQPGEGRGMDLPDYTRVTVIGAPSLVSSVLSGLFPSEFSDFFGER